MNKSELIGLVPGMTEANCSNLPSDQITNYLSEYNLKEWIPVLNYINTSWENGGKDDKKWRQKLTNLFIRPTIRNRLGIYEQKNPNKEIFPFHSKQFLTLIKLLWRHGKLQDGITRSCTDDWFRLGDILLSIDNTFAVKVKYPENSKDPKALISQYLDLKHNSHLFSMPIGASLLYRDYVLSSLDQENDLQGCISESLGINASCALQAVFVLQVLFSQLTPEAHLLDKIGDIDYRYIFGVAGIPKKEGDWVIDRLSHQFDEGPRLIQDSYPTLIDKGVFMRKPLLRISDHRIVCIDLDCFENAFSRFLFNMCREIPTSLLIDKIEPLYGIAMEDYCTDQLRRAMKIRNRSNAAIIEPVRVGKFERDGGYMEDGVVALLECKSMPLSNSAALATDPDVTIAELNDRFIFGNEKSSGGVSQLYRRCLQLLECPEKFGVQSKIKEVIPVLVVNDEVLASSMVIRYVRRVVADMWKPFGKKVQLPLIIQASDFELLASAAKSVSLVGALQRWQNERLSMLNFRIWFGETYNLEEGEDRLIHPHSILDRFTLQLQEAFTPDPTSVCPYCSDSRVIYGSGDKWYWQCRGCDRGTGLADISEANNAFESQRSFIDKYEKTG